MLIFFSLRHNESQQQQQREIFVDTKTPYISKLIEQKSGKMNGAKGLVEVIWRALILN